MHDDWDYLLDDGDNLGSPSPWVGLVVLVLIILFLGFTVFKG